MTNNSDNGELPKPPRTSPDALTVRQVVDLVAPALAQELHKLGVGLTVTISANEVEGNAALFEAAVEALSPWIGYYHERQAAVVAVLRAVGAMK